jgi:hypothetical protein
LRIDREIPAFIARNYEEAETHAQNALKKLRASKALAAKISFSTANAYLDLAERNLKQVREPNEKLRR